MAAATEPARETNHGASEPATSAVALVRHGQYEQPEGVPSAHLPYPLTRQGRDHARAAATELLQFAEERGLTVSERVDCSTMLRAWETATILAEQLSTRLGKRLQVVQHAALAERCLGAAANLSVEAIERIIRADPRFEAPPPGWKRDPDYRVPLQGAESLMEAGQRVAAHLSRRLRESPERTLAICVGHGGAFRHAALVCGVLSRQQVAELSMFHGRPVFLAPKGSLADIAAPAEAQSALPMVQVGGNWKQRFSKKTYD